jgi:small glutamine-rich tetratricopeptide repeat-containing protein alpha
VHNELLFLLAASELDPSNENVWQFIEVTKKKLAEQRGPPEEQVL